MRDGERNEQRGTEKKAQSHRQVQDGSRDQGASQGRSVQRRLRRAEETPPDSSAGQEALQDRNTQAGHMLHRLSQPRARRLANHHKEKYISKIISGKDN